MLYTIYLLEEDILNMRHCPQILLWYIIVNDNVDIFFDGEERLLPAQSDIK